MSTVIPDIDIWRSANLLVKRHGEDAPIEAPLCEQTPGQCRTKFRMN